MDPDTLKRRRQALGWTQDQLAQRAGVRRATVNEWESGKRQPLRIYEAELERVLTAAERRRKRR